MLTDIEIAQAATPKPITEIAQAAGVPEKYLEQYGTTKAKVDYNLGIKKANHAANAAMSRMSGATYRLGAANAKRLGNLNATSAWIQGGADAGIKLASAFL